MCDIPPLYFEEPAPTSKVILVSCDNVVQLEIVAKKLLLEKKWFLKFTPDQGKCQVEKMDMDRGMYRWRRAYLPVEISLIGQQFVIGTPEVFSNGYRLLVGSK